MVDEEEDEKWCKIKRTVARGARESSDTSLFRWCCCWLAGVDGGGTVDDDSYQVEDDTQLRVMVVVRVDDIFDSFFGEQTNRCTLQVVVVDVLELELLLMMAM